MKFTGLQIRKHMKIIFLISQLKHMLWVLKRTVSMRRFFREPKTHVKMDGQENIHNCTLKSFAYLYDLFLHIKVYLFNDA